MTTPIYMYGLLFIVMFGTVNIATGSINDSRAFDLKYSQLRSKYIREATAIHIKFFAKLSNQEKSNIYRLMAEVKSAEQNSVSLKPKFETFFDALFAKYDIQSIFEQEDIVGILGCLFVYNK